MCPEAEFYVNPTGKFVIGGPDGDAGLTGRKIIVDTYGGAAPHGGGAFSGKDPTKVDRSAAYAARYLAKNVVAAGLARRCVIQLSYAIGVSKPLSIYVDTYGTGEVDEQRLGNVLNEVMNLSPRGIREHLQLNRPIYARTSAYGHFGRAARRPTAASRGSGPTSPTSCGARSTERHGRGRRGPAAAPRRQIHGRRQGPKLRPGLRRLIDERLPAVGVSVDPADAALDPPALFADPPRAVWLEIGFGGGEHLAALAAAHPDVGFLGVEPFLNGVAKLLRAIDEKALPQRPRADGRRAPAAEGAAGREHRARLRAVPRPLAQAAPPQAAHRQPGDGRPTSPG